MLDYVNNATEMEIYNNEITDTNVNASVSLCPSRVWSQYMYHRFNESCQLGRNYAKLLLGERYKQEVKSQQSYESKM
jgi:hypothetical protein